MVMIRPMNMESDMQAKKIVINSSRGGFGLSPEATLELYRRGCRGIQATKVEDIFPEKGEGSALDFDEQIYRWRAYLSSSTPLDPFQIYFSLDERFVLACPSIDRDDPDLVAVVEQIGDKANGMLSTLEIVEIPDDIAWQVEECDGLEHVAEAHRSWFGSSK
jgi:hypothetical protein